MGARGAHLLSLSGREHLGGTPSRLSGAVVEVERDVALDQLVRGRWNPLEEGEIRRLGVVRLMLAAVGVAVVLAAAALAEKDDAGLDELGGLVSFGVALHGHLEGVAAQEQPVLGQGVCR